MILSIGGSSYIISSNLRVLIFTEPSDSPIFFLGVKISLCSMPCSLFSVVLLSLYRCILSTPYYLAFYFAVKTALLSVLNNQTFFFQRENPSLFFIKFLSHTQFSNVAASLFLHPVFFFFFVKSSLRSLLISLYIRASAFHPALFLFAWIFLSISSVKTLYF